MVGSAGTSLLAVSLMVIFSSRTRSFPDGLSIGFVFLVLPYSFLLRLKENA